MTILYMFWREQTPQGRAPSVVSAQLAINIRERAPDDPGALRLKLPGKTCATGGLDDD